MKKSIFFVLLTGILFGCAPNAQITNSWRAPDVSINTQEIHKFVVAALLKDQSVRRSVEDQMASFMPDKAVQSYIEFGTDNLKDSEELYNQKLKSEGYDGIVVMRLVNINKNTRYVRGTYPVYYGSWRNYWGYSWGGFYNPGYYTTDKTYNVEVNVYSLNQNKLIWTAITSTINPAGNNELFKDASKAVYKKMKAEGFLKS